MSEVLAHRSRALTPDETEALLRDRLGDGVQRAIVAAGVFTLWVDPSAWVEAATRCRDERLLAYDMFDTLFGVDARDEGFDVVAVLYSTSTGNRIALRARCEGGREGPSLPSLTEVYRGANWMERETYDMFGIVFPGHPGLEPRILTVENFEGWPLRKDFHLAARVAKPWPGVAEPVELDEDGNVIERVVGIGDAPGPYELDKAMAAQAKQVNAPPAAPTEGAGDAADDAADAARAEDGTSAEVAASATASGPTVDAPVDEDRAARAKAKAEERRRKQAEARAAKAQARAARTTGGDAPAGPDDTADTGLAADMTVDAGGAAGAVAPPDTGAGSTPADEADTGGVPQADTGGVPQAGEAPAPTDAKAKAEERRRKQDEARKARAAARAAKAGGPAEGDTDAAGDAASSDAATSTPADAAPDAHEDADAAADDAPTGAPEATTSAPDADDREARAKAKAEERRRKQAELRAARAKARAERTEATEDGEDDA